MPTGTDSASFARILRIVLACAAVASLAGAPRARADAFSETRLAEGAALSAQARYREAADRLRIACFGLLEEPPRLAEALARLAAAEEAGGSAERARAAALRLVEVERRFRVFGAVHLDAPTAQALRRLLVRVAPEEVASLPALAAFAQLPRAGEVREAAAPAAAPPVAAPRDVPRVSPGAEWLEKARAAARAGDDKETIHMADRALDADGALDEARALRAHARAARMQCRGALADLSELPRTAFERDPALHADEFVCLVERGRWDEALAAAGAVPSSAAGRHDVTRAWALLLKERPGTAKQIARGGTRNKEVK